MFEPTAGLTIIDVHAHLADGQFRQDVGEVLHRARQNGVLGVVAVSETAEEVDAILALAQQWPKRVFACAGLHPEHAFLDALPNMLQVIRENEERLVGVGEIGLDFTPRVLGADPEHTKAVQREVLTQQVNVAKSIGLPVNCHSRSAGHHVIELLKELQATQVVLHAFDGRPHYALEGVRHGFYFSVPPSIVRSPQKQKLVQRLPLESLLLETDSPVLGPEKDVRNEPANALVACRAVAEIKGMSVEDVAKVTTRNARALFTRLL